MISDKSFRIVLICHDGDLINRRALPRWIQSFASLSGVLVIREKRGMFFRRVRSEYRRIGALRLLDVFAFRCFYLLFLRRSDRRWMREELQRLDAQLPRLSANVPIKVVSDPNRQVAADFIASCTPSVVIARCSRLLSRSVYSIPRLGTYVLHPGICPEYRNAHGCFWALANRDLERVGLTLLKIDEGIDTGPVYAYFRCKFDELRESHIRIQYKMLTENLDAIREAILEIAAGRAQPVPVNGRNSRVWGQPWLSAYARWKRSAARRTA